jgi:RNase adaptor protein for sRNA GlmZ degradation
MNKITLISFGFKYGPPNANYYFDVGFLKNPARESNWGFFSDPDENMKKYILDQTNSKKFIESVVPLIIFLAEIDQKQVFAFGCNAGRHRSNVIVDELARILKDKGLEVDVKHRDLV